MSYARFGWDDSDVYVFLNISGFLDCCGCSLEAWGEMTRYETTADMLAHLEHHRHEGHTVPERCIERLKADATDNDRWIAQEALK